MSKFKKFVLSALIGILSLSSSAVFASPKKVAYYLSHRRNTFYKVKENAKPVTDFNTLTIKIVRSESFDNLPEMVSCNNTEPKSDSLPQFKPKRDMVRSQSTDIFLTALNINNKPEQSILVSDSCDTEK